MPQDQTISEAVASVELHYVSARRSEEHAVPFNRVKESVEGCRRVLELIATLHGEAKSNRNSLASSKKTSVEVFLKTPQPGSICLPVECIAGAKDLFASSSSKQLETKFWNILSAVNNENLQEIRNYIPCETNLKRVLSEIESIFNSFDEDYQLILKDTRSKCQIRSDSIGKSHQKIWQQMDSEESVFPAFLGEVNKINFKNKSVTLSDPTTKLSVSLQYKDEQERVLIDSAREFVEVHGDVYKDSSGKILKVKNLTEFVPVDLADMRIQDLLPPFLEPRDAINSKVTIELSDNKSVYFGTFDELEIYAGGHTRASIESEIRSEITVLWKDLVRERYTNLSPYAQLLKEKLSALFKEKSDGV